MSPPGIEHSFDVCTPAPRDVWRQVAMADPRSTPAQLPEWADSIIEHAGWEDASRAYTFASGRTVVVPMVTKRVAGIRVADRSWPEGWSSGRPIAEGGVRPEEVAAICRDLARSRRPSMSIRLPGQPPDGLPRGLRVTQHPTLVVDVSAGLEYYRTQTLRRKVRKTISLAEGEDLEIRSGNSSDLIEAFAVLSRSTTDRWAQDRGQPLVIARALARHRDRPGRLAAGVKHFGEACKIWVAWSEGKPVSTAVAVYGANRGIGWMLAIDKQALGKSRASTLLAKLTIEEAFHRGLGSFDLGESDPGSGAEGFKMRLGAVPEPVWQLTGGRLPIDRFQELGRSALGRLKVEGS